MLHVDAGILEAWREDAAEESEWMVRMLLTSAASPEHALAVARDAVRALKWEDGEWDLLALRTGVLIQVREADPFDAILTDLVIGLEQRGIDGTLSCWELPPAAQPPEIAHLLECRLSVVGARSERVPQSYLWTPDSDAHLRVITAADRWCHAFGPAAHYAFGSGTVMPVAIRPQESVAERMRDDVARGLRVQLHAIGEHEFRMVLAVPHSGRVTLIAGSVDGEHLPWHQVLAEFIDLLDAHARDLAYGYVKRGWSIESFGFGTCPLDWPVRAHYAPTGIGFTEYAFDDLLVPDAFGVQLLGEGFAGRVDPGDEWTISAVAENRTLVQARALEAWFETPFLEFPDEPTPLGGVEVARAAAERPAPEVLARARGDFASILFTPDALTALGHPNR